ncbi:15535_t:CDS:2, partial [Dentiscutata heterogama]
AAQLLGDLNVRMKWEPEREIFSAGGKEDQGKTRHDLVRGDKK